MPHRARLLSRVLQTENIAYKPPSNTSRTWIETEPKSWKIAHKPRLLYTTLRCPFTQYYLQITNEWPRKEALNADYLICSETRFDLTAQGHATVTSSNRSDGHSSSLKKTLDDVPCSVLSVSTFTKIQHASSSKCQPAIFRHAWHFCKHFPVVKAWVCLPVHQVYHVHSKRKDQVVFIKKFSDLSIDPHTKLCSGISEQLCTQFNVYIFHEQFSVMCKQFSVVCKAYYTIECNFCSAQLQLRLLFVEESFWEFTLKLYIVRNIVNWWSLILYLLKCYSWWKVISWL